MINWLKENNLEGTASLYDTNITFNTVITKWLKDAYRVMVGIDEQTSDIIVAPINKDRADKNDIDSVNLLKIAIKSTYSRISSSSLMKNIAQNVGLSLCSAPLKLKAVWDDGLDAVRIFINEGGK